MTPQELSQKIQVLSKQYNLAIRSNKWTDALQIAKNLVKLNAKSAVCYNYRGFAYFKLGQFAKSRLDFEHVLRLDTSNKNALSMLEKINNIEPQVVEEEMETVPISNLDVKAYNEANQETKILASTKSLEIEDAFIEETTTQIIYEQPIVAVAQITEPQNTTIENNPKYLTHNISKPMLIGGGVTLVIGVFIGIFLLGEPANIKNENVQEIASYTTIFDNPHVEPIKDINFDINTTKESDPQENVVATIENMNDVPDMVAKPNLEESNTTKEIVLEVKAKVEETVFEIKSDPIKKDLVEEDINNKVINEIAKQESVSQEKIEKKSIPIDFMGVTIDLAVSRNIVFVIDNSSSMQKMNGQYKKIDGRLV